MNRALSRTELAEQAQELFTVDEMMSKIIKPKIELLNVLTAIRNSYPDVDLEDMDKLIVTTRNECAPYLKMGTSKIKCHLKARKEGSNKLTRAINGSEQVIKMKTIV